MGLNKVFTCCMSKTPATLQLCIDQKCLILQLFYMDEIPDSIKAFLINPNFTFVGIGVPENVTKPKDEYRLVCCSRGDILDAAKTRWPAGFRLPRLKDLAWEVCGLWIKKPKHIGMSNWQARVLSEAQLVECACIDAFASYNIGHQHVGMSNWEARVLSWAQVEYASIDALAS